MTSERPNFFVLLKLDPRASWDQPLFERTVAGAQDEWARIAQKGLPKAKVLEAKRRLRLLAEIRRVLEDPDQRKAERDKAIEDEATAFEARRKAVERQVNLMLARGYLLDEEVVALRRDHGDVLASDRALALRVENAKKRPAQADSSGNRLDDEAERTLERHLSEIGELSVYDVLKRVDESITPNSSEEKLREAAQRLWQKVHDIKVKDDPSLAAQDRLATMAKTDLFPSTEQRRRHDRSMTFAKLNTVAEGYKEALAASRTVSAAQFELYLTDSRKAGVEDVELAKRHFVELFAGSGWTVEMPAAEAEERLRRSVQCPRCAQLHEPGTAACRTCGLLLREPCPSCGDVAPSYGFGCRCGFPIGQRFLVEDLVAQAKRALGEHDFGQAETYLGRASKIWELPPDRPDRLAGEITTTRAALADALGAVEKAKVGIERLLGERRYVAALRAIRAAPEGLGRRETLLARAETEIERARTLFRQAKKPGTPRARQADLYAEALRVCHDFEPARDELARMPPEPPTRLEARIPDATAGVVLTWIASPDPDVSYVVVRSPTDSPVDSVGDFPGHHRVGTTTETTFRDRAAAELAGVPLRYAVFTDRSDTFSSPATTKPVVVAADADLEARGEAGQVVLTWSVPDTAVRVEVSREQLGSGGPVVLPVAEPGHLTDTGVSNGIRYRYTVRTAYPAPDGGLLWSGGSARDVTPAKPPTPPGPLTVTEAKLGHDLVVHRVQLRWPPPERGTVQVIRQRDGGTLREGDRLPENELYRAGRVLSGKPPVADLWIEEDLVVCTYVPVVVVDGVGYAGELRRYARVEEPSEVTGEFAGKQLRLRWLWPEGGAEVLVGYDTTREVLDPTVVPGQLRVWRRDGDREGRCEIPAVPEANLHVVVATVVEREGLYYATSGVPARISRPGERRR